MTVLKERIVRLRRAGKSRRQIKEILGPMSNSTLDDALRGEPPPEWTRRPTDRELLIAGAIAYWCEGGKSKSYTRSDRVIFTNSDPALIRFFLRFLDMTGIPHCNLRFRVCIHENADVEAAQQFWIDVTGTTAVQFFTPALKHHNPVTVRKNVGETYHGCLRIDVKRSADLYRRIEGWSSAITSGA